MTSDEITAEANNLMEAVQHRVALRDALQLTLWKHCPPKQRRYVREQCRELTALNRAARKRLIQLDQLWEKLNPEADARAA